MDPIRMKQELMDESMNVIEEEEEEQKIDSEAITELVSKFKELFDENEFKSKIKTIILEAFNDAEPSPEGNSFSQYKNLMKNSLTSLRIKLDALELRLKNIEAVQNNFKINYEEEQKRQQAMFNDSTNKTVRAFNEQIQQLKNSSVPRRRLQE